MEQGREFKCEGPLPDYFDCTLITKANGDQWRLVCKACDAGWLLPAKNNHPGNILYLLNHARSHNKRD